MLKSEGLSEGEALDDRKYEVGDKVHMFIQSVSRTDQLLLSLVWTKYPCYRMTRTTFYLGNRKLSLIHAAT